MNFLKKLFGKNKKQEAAKIEPQLDDDKQEMIKVHDEYGREVMITKKDWLNNVLLGNLEANKDNPNELYNLLLSAINDGFERHVLTFAEHLYNVDPIKERGACLYAIALIKNDKLDIAENVLKQTMALIGETGALLTNLAKVYSNRGEQELAESILWNALEVDPNQDNGLDWYAAIYYERDGKQGYLDAYKRANQLPNAWRPNLWLARESLENNNLDEALEYYQQLFCINTEPDAQTLQQISGDLGIKGYLKEAIDLIAPKFSIKYHGLMVGNNLIKAYIDSQQIHEAQALVKQLFSENRPDWRENLSYWQNELDELTHEYGPLDSAEKPKLGLIAIEEPAWLHKLKHVSEKVKSKDSAAPIVLSTSASCSLGVENDQVIVQPTNAEGALCRGLPMSLCDKLNIDTQAQATMLLPVIEEGGFAFFGERYDEEMVRNLISQYQCDVFLLPHLNAIGDLWQFEIAIFDVEKKSTIKTIVKEFSKQNPSLALKELVDEVSNYLKSNYSIESNSSLLSFESVKTNYFAHYVDANESCLALSLACNLPNGSSTLYGERNIFDKLLHLALEESSSDIHKLIFISALAKNKAYDSQIYKEYQQKAEKLLSQGVSNMEIGKLINEELSLIFTGEE